MTRTPRLTRALVNRLPTRVDERGPIRVAQPDPDYHDRTGQQIMSNLHAPDALWVFAVGSLIWNPRCTVVERRPALVRGWQRPYGLSPRRPPVPTAPHNRPKAGPQPTRQTSPCPAPHGPDASRTTSPPRCWSRLLNATR